MGMSDSFLSDASVMALFLFFVRGDLHVQNDTESQRSDRVLFRGSVKVQSCFLRDSASLTDACSSSQHHHKWCCVPLSRPAHIIRDVRVQERSSPVEAFMQSRTGRWRFVYMSVPIERRRLD